MNIVRAIEPHGLEIVALQKVQRDQFGGSLAGRWIFIDLVTVIVDGDGPLDLGGVLGKVLIAEETAIRFGEGGKFAGDIAFIKPVARGL